MFLLFGIEFIVGLISINLHLQKLSGRLQLHAHFLPTNHILYSLIEPKAKDLTKLYLLSLRFLSKHQCQLIKGSIVNINNHFNKVFSSFDPLNSEFSPGCRIIDTFSSHFSFHSFSKCNKNSFKSHVHRLDELTIESSNNPSHTLVIMDASIKNNITMSILHIHIHNKPITKTLHHVVNVTSTEAELFTIRCGINQTTNSPGISKIIVVTDSIHTAKNFFDSSFHHYQSHTASILKELQAFFSCHQENSIKFWECPSHCNWSLHKMVAIETKSFNPIPLFPSKSSWDFSKKKEYNKLANRWKMIFQAFDMKGKSFLNLTDSNDKTIKLTYIKGSS